MNKRLTDERLAELERLCEQACRPDRGDLVSFCHVHDYSDPGFPPEDCLDCTFERDEARAKLADAVVTDLPALITELRVLRRKVAEAEDDKDG